MNIEMAEMTTESLMKVCRICLGDGELNIWDYKVKLPPSNDEHGEEEDANSDMEGDKTVDEMMQIFGKWDHNVLNLGSELQLICYDCLSEFLTCYMYYKKLERANEQVIRLYKEALKMETELNSEEEVEFLEESNDEDNFSEKEEYLESSSEMYADEEDPNICNDETKMIETQMAETPPQQRKSDKITKFKIPKNIPHATNTNNEVPHKTAASKPKRQKIQRVAKTQQCESTPTITTSHMANASLVVTQFIPSAAQITMEMPLQPSANEQQGVTSEALSTNELRTIDYAAVEIKGDHIKEIIEDALNIQAASTPTEFIDNEKNEQGPLPVYACKYCPQAFSAPRYLMTHVRKSHVCQFCTMAFTKNSDLYEHIKKAHQEHKCVICCKEFSSHSNLRGHIKRVHGLKLPAQVALLDYRPNATNEDVHETATDSQSEHRTEQQLQYIVGEQG